MASFAVGAGGEEDLLRAAKRAAAVAALELLQADMVIGVGTGSTATEFIRAIVESPLLISAAVPSSTATERLLLEHGIPIASLNEIGSLSLYIDGADEIDSHLRLIKGAGGALTREKICAFAAERFICIADDSKFNDAGLGLAAVPIEIIPMSRRVVEGVLGELGAEAFWRQDYITDNGNHILDCRGLDMSDPRETELVIEAIPGVVASGIFARRPADAVLLGSPDGSVREIHREGETPSLW